MKCGWWGGAHRQHDRPAVEAAVVLERPRRDVRQRDPQVPALGQHERLRAVLLLLERRFAADELEALGQLAALAQVGGETGRHLAPPAEGDAAERFAAALPPRRQLADPRLVRRRRAADRQRRGDLRQRPPERAAGLLVVVVVVRAEAAAPDPAERRAEPAEAVAGARRLLRLLRVPRSSKSFFSVLELASKAFSSFFLGGGPPLGIAGRDSRTMMLHFTSSSSRQIARQRVAAQIERGVNTQTAQLGSSPRLARRAPPRRRLASCRLLLQPCAHALTLFASRTSTRTAYFRSDRNSFSTSLSSYVLSDLASLKRRQASRTLPLDPRWDAPAPF